MPIHEPEEGEELFYYYTSGGLRRKLKVRVWTYPIERAGQYIWTLATVEVQEVLEDSTNSIFEGQYLDVEVRNLSEDDIDLDAFVRPSDEELGEYVAEILLGDDDSIWLYNTNNNNNNAQQQNNVENSNQVLIVPAGSETVIGKNTIENNNRLVNWSDPGSRPESNYGRYYTLEEYQSLPRPKRNPATRQNIQNPRVYRALVNPLPATNTTLFDGGRRRRRNHRSKRTRRSSKKRKASSRRRKNGTLRRNV